MKQALLETLNFATKNPEFRFATKNPEFRHKWPNFATKIPFWTHFPRGMVRSGTFAAF